MSFEDGDSITSKAYLKKNKIKMSEISTLLSEVFNRQIFELGFVHADPHPGNLFVRKENGKVKLVLLDHGLYRSLDKKFKYNYAKLWRGIFTQDKELLRESCENLGATKVELFISMLTNKNFDELMDDEGKFTENRFSEESIIFINIQKLLRRLKG